MRTTLQIDDDVLAAAKVLAENQKRPIGNVISDLARGGPCGGQNNLASETEYLCSRPGLEDHRHA